MQMYESQQEKSKEHSQTAPKKKLIPMLRHIGISLLTILFILVLFVAITDIYNLRNAAMIMMISLTALLISAAILIYSYLPGYFEAKYWKQLDTPLLQTYVIVDNPEKVTKKSIFIKDEYEKRQQCNHILEKYGLKVDEYGRLKGKIEMEDNIRIDRLEQDDHGNDSLLRIRYCDSMIAMIEYKDLKYILTLYTNY